MSHFHVCWAVDIRGCVFSAVLSNSCQKTTMADFRYKSIKSWKIDNIDLTQSLHSRKWVGGGGGVWPVGNHYHLEIQSSFDDSNIPSRKIAKSSSYRELEANNLNKEISIWLGKECKMLCTFHFKGSKTWILNIHDQGWTLHLNKIDKEVQTKNTRQFCNKFSVSLSTFFSTCHALKHSSSYRG